MLWVCEMYPPGHNLWSEKNFLLSVEVLLDKVGTFFTMKRLPHFFIPEQNLLEDIPCGVLQGTEEKVKKIRQKVLFYVPFDLEPLSKWFKIPTEMTIEAKILLRLLRRNAEQ